MTGTRPLTYWLLGNRYFGVSVKRARTGREALADYRDAIAESFTEQGLSASASRRAASSYQVFVIAGDLDHTEATDAAEAWWHDDCAPALKLAEEYYGSVTRVPRLLVARG